MVLDSLSSPHRRTQNLISFLTSYKKPFTTRDFDGWANLFQRHRFLLTMLAVLGFLCTVYLYFAVTLGPTVSCSGLNGAKKSLCELEGAKSSMSHKGKLRFF
ncbi:hypothetical protein AMTRI_Chr01g126700 [Amborella trichopoda]|uniref:Uncharacterized protein n=1 Tax=Amborella trichopoda TaxID=13333 RepID=W1NR20_AMBTC|nr:uncharacterized protein LOC18425234 [Amborella trichopoda]ERM97279.1 hypothetical protein AMTR_s00119p00131870 [Amborella trichopoda]|eukprot:XP_006829863.1 uncharacterized protein LOC18425234 [Amborella trichopoda]